jgi:RecA/RadA recombinase
MATRSTSRQKESRVRRVKEEVEDSADRVAGGIEEHLRQSYLDSLSDVEKRVSMTETSSLSKDRMSTGLASLDLLLGGGIIPGWYTFFGMEGTCKTTSILTAMGAAVKQDRVPVVAIHDYEGSSLSDPDYFTSVMSTLGVKGRAEDIFGVKDSSGKYVVAPKIRYYSEAVGEKFFDWMAALQRRLPDKQYLAGQWWYVYEDNKNNKAKFGEISDQKMNRNYGNGIYVPARNGDLQAMVLVDSYPTMNPEALDEDDPNNSIAVQARMFSRNIPRITGRLTSKRIAILGVNQLRSVPMAMYGPSETEPGGQALRFASGCRVKLTARGSGMPFNPVIEKGFETQDSAEYENRKDTYRYIHMKNIKNKYGQPMREGWLRLWVEDGAGNARGFDPTFDTIEFMRQTGQLSGKRAALRLNINGKGESKRTISIADFKYLVLGDKAIRVEMFKKLGYDKPMDLRAGIFKQLASGKAEDLYIAHKNSNVKESSEG